MVKSAPEGERSMPVFRGVTELALDAKGRFAVPARHRDAIVAESGSALVLTADPSRCLLLYPLAAWEPIQARLMARHLRGELAAYPPCVLR